MIIGAIIMIGLGGTIVAAGIAMLVIGLKKIGGED